MTVTPAYREGCVWAGCGIEDFLGKPHLRVQVSPPEQPWTMLRFCDLICLQSWLEVEAREPRVFVNEEWIDSHG